MPSVFMGVAPFGWLYLLPCYFYTGGGAVFQGGGEKYFLAADFCGRRGN